MASTNNKKQSPSKASKGNSSASAEIKESQTTEKKFLGGEVRLEVFNAVDDSAEKDLRKRNAQIDVLLEEALTARGYDFAPVVITS